MYFVHMYYNTHFFKKKVSLGIIRAGDPKVGDDGLSAEMNLPDNLS